MTDYFHLTVSVLLLVKSNIPVKVVVGVAIMTVKMMTVIIKRQRTVMPRMMIKPIQQFVPRSLLRARNLLRLRLESEHIVIDGFYLST